MVDMTGTWEFLPTVLVSLLRYAFVVMANEELLGWRLFPKMETCTVRRSWDFSCMASMMFKDFIISDEVTSENATEAALLEPLEES